MNNIFAETLRSGVEPTPVSVEDNTSLDSSATATGLTGLPGECRVDFSSLRTNLLGTHNGEERESEERCCREHCALGNTVR